MIVMTALQAAALWSGLLILLLVGLAFRVIANRRRHRVLFGDGDVPQMTVAARAFGNAAEYIPVGIGALVLLALTGSAPGMVHAVGGVLLLGRLIHGVGLSHGRGPGPGRMIGMVLTLTALIAAAVLLLVAAFAS
ncbi:MAG: MAPEG family protein [Brevundimonas sp.]|uniref:MAPEG family protein n=1 Tax=Brevundimonas sp. TaxID=1871086 RepID=UPI001803E293|nr:MAPEG family protein [Brevundimonas sp.]MBA4805370.1 MAPEG family protein [Brevundimonas sp.]